MTRNDILRGMRAKVVNRNPEYLLPFLYCCYNLVMFSLVDALLRYLYL